MLFDRRRNDFADRQRLGLVLLLDLIGASVEAQGIIRDADDRTVLGNDDLDALRLELVLDLIKHVFANGLRFAGVRDLLAEVIGLSFEVLLSLRSEEHTSELQSRFDLVCRLLLEKKI